MMPPWGLYNDENYYVEELRMVTIMMMMMMMMVMTITIMMMMMTMNIENVFDNDLE